MPRSSLPPWRSPVSPKGPLMSQVWVQWLNDLLGSLGWNKDLPLYKDLVLPAESMEHDATVVTLDGGIGALQAADATSTFFNFTMRLPNDYRKGTNFTPFVDWISISGSGNVHWLLSSGYADLGSTLTEDDSEVVQAVAPATATLVRSDFAGADDEGIDGSLFKKGGTFKGTLSRLGSEVTDTHNGNIVICSFGIKYQAEGVGTEKAHP